MSLLNQIGKDPWQNEYLKWRHGRTSIVMAGTSQDKPGHDGGLALPVERL
jgi:hypothetical protein